MIVTKINNYLYKISGNHHYNSQAAYPKAIGIKKYEHRITG